MSLKRSYDALAPDSVDSQSTRQEGEAWIETSSCENAEPSALVKRQKRAETLSLAERKEVLIWNPTGVMKTRMQLHVDLINKLFDPKLPKCDCWLHPWPPEVKMLPTGTIQVRFNWKDGKGTHSLDVNYGVITLILEGKITKEQKDGFIYESWQLSHVCGNWICCNPQHFTIEPKPINLDRNRCFSSEEDCMHFPQCKRTKKRAMLMTQNIRRRNYHAIRDIDGFTYLYGTDQSLYDFWDMIKGVTAPGSYCDFCKRVHILAPFCKLLNSPAKCRQMLEMLATQPATSVEATKARLNLVKHYQNLTAEGKIMD